jgi:hypothetical protein
MYRVRFAALDTRTYPALGYFAPVRYFSMGATLTDAIEGGFTLARLNGYAIHSVADVTSLAKQES